MFGFRRRISEARSKEDQRVREVFSRIVKADVVDSLMSSESLQKGPLRECHLGVVVAMVRGPDVSTIADGATRIADIAAARKAVLWSIPGPLIVMSLGALNDGWPELDPEALRALLAELSADLQSRIKIVHWQGTAHVGVLGGETGSWFYSPVVPGFERMIGELCRLEFGEVAEFKG